MLDTDDCYHVIWELILNHEIKILEMCVCIYIYIATIFNPSPPLIFHGSPTPPPTLKKWEVNTDDDNKTEGISQVLPNLWRLSSLLRKPIIDKSSISMCSHFPCFLIEKKLEYFAYLIGFLTWMDFLLLLRPILLFSPLQYK